MHNYISVIQIMNIFLEHYWNNIIDLTEIIYNEDNFHFLFIKGECFYVSYNVLDFC